MKKSNYRKIELKYRKYIRRICVFQTSDIFYTAAYTDVS